MPDVRLHPGFPEHEKVLHAIELGGTDAGLLFVNGLCVAVADATDGLLRTDRALKLALGPHVPGALFTPADAAQRAIDALLHAGLWHHTPAGYVIHDFADYQVTTAELERKRHRDRERVRCRRRLARDSRATPPGVQAPQQGFQPLSENSQPQRSSAGTLDNFSADAGLLGVIAAELRDSQGHRTLSTLKSVSEGLPDSVLAEEFEALKQRRADTGSGRLRSESAWLVARLKQRRARLMVPAVALREIG